MTGLKEEQELNTGTVLENSSLWPNSVCFVKNDRIEFIKQSQNIKENRRMR